MTLPQARAALVTIDQARETLAQRDRTAAFVGYADRELAESLRAAIKAHDELAATLANERGEGGPPSEGWESGSAAAPGFHWHRPEASVSFVTGTTYGGVGFKRWEWRVYRSRDRGEADTARAAMKAADAALAALSTPRRRPMTRRKIALGPKPHTRIELRSRPGTKPAWSRTLLISDKEPDLVTMRAFVDSARNGVAGIDAFMDTLSASPAHLPTPSTTETKP